MRLPSRLSSKFVSCANGILGNVVPIVCLCLAPRNCCNGRPCSTTGGSADVYADWQRSQQRHFTSDSLEWMAIPPLRIYTSTVGNEVGRYRGSSHWKSITYSDLHLGKEERGSQVPIKSADPSTSKMTLATRIATTGHHRGARLLTNPVSQPMPPRGAAHLQLQV